jgi:hypothetical protein
MSLRAKLGEKEDSPEDEALTARAGIKGIPYFPVNNMDFDADAKSLLSSLYPAFNPSAESKDSPANKNVGVDPDQMSMTIQKKSNPGRKGVKSKIISS